MSSDGITESRALPFERHGDAGTLVLFLHWLSGSKQTWRAVASRLADRGHMCIALDLPGFGDAANDSRFSVGAMVEAVLSTLATLRKDHAPWILVGHSMGGKVATVIARAAADGDARAGNLAGVALVSASPPWIEPMKESKRAELLRDLGASTGDAEQDRTYARDFVTENTGEPSLAADVLDAAVQNVLSMNRDAWNAWLLSGRKEDWSNHVGRLPQKMLLVCGEHDEQLGAKTARAFLERHVIEPKNAEIVELAGAAHLAPLERCDELADLIAAFVESQNQSVLRSKPSLDGRFAALIASRKTSPRTRELLQARLECSLSDEEHVLDESERDTLRALVECIVPGAPPQIAVRVEQMLAEGCGDGWRLDALPDDLTAWKRGLGTFDVLARSVYDAPFFSLNDAQRQTILKQIDQRDDGLSKRKKIADHPVFTASQASDWFAEARADIAKIYMSDPRAYARVGFHGFADEDGFTKIRLGEREEFER